MFFLKFASSTHIQVKGQVKLISRWEFDVLKSKLMSMGYGVTAIKGTYIENYGSSNAREVSEESFLVVDLKDKGTLKKDLIKLGEMFEQDSITYSLPSGEYYLISTNKCPDGYPGNGRIGVEVKLGKPLFGEKGEFHSKVNGRPFVFEGAYFDRVVTLLDHYPTEIRGIKALNELTEDELDKFVRG